MPLDSNFRWIMETTMISSVIQGEGAQFAHANSVCWTIILVSRNLSKAFTDFMEEPVQVKSEAISEDQQTPAQWDTIIAKVVFAYKS